MAVTDPHAIVISDEVLRVNANRLVALYYRCVMLTDQWAALGGGQTALDVMREDVVAGADEMKAAFFASGDGESEWIAQDGPALIPKDPDQPINDGAGEGTDTRPAVTTHDAHAVANRLEQKVNWLRSPTGNFDDGARSSRNYLNTVLQAGRLGAKPLDLNTAANQITRCNELRTRYEANSNAELNTLLVYATRRP